MKLITVFAATVSAALAGPVQFTYQGMLASSGIRIDVGGYAAPVMVDWDGDGKQDMLCGQFDYGRIRFYRNTGSDDSPEFDGYQYLLDDASYLSVPYG